MILNVNDVKKRSNNKETRQFNSTIQHKNKSGLAHTQHLRGLERGNFLLQGTSESINRTSELQKIVSSWKKL